MSENVRITVAIPTRERCDTLYYALRTVLRQDYPALEVLVSDNASTDATAEMVRDLGDPRVRYVNTGHRVGMARNYEFALSHVRPGWVTILGDDDGLLPGALAYVDEVVRESGCEVLTSRVCQYYWPGLRSGAECETLVSVPLGVGYEVRDATPWLRDVMEGRCYHGDLPMLYTGGFASTALIDRARDGQGAFYRSMFPDVYSGLVLGWLAGRYAMLNRPVAVAGASAHSTGFSQFADSGRAAIQRFYAEDNIPCHEALDEGRVASLPLAYFECYLQGIPVHGDFLGLTLRDQLALAVTEARGDEEEDGYLRRVAARNALDFDEICAQARRRKDTRARQKARRREALKGVRVVRGAYGAENVLEAVCVCAGIYGEAHRRRTSRAARPAPAGKPSAV